MRVQKEWLKWQS